jgi:hypothetical protein
MEFNITRLGLLLKRHFLVSGKKYAVGIAIGTGVVLVLSLANILNGGTAQISQFNQYALFTYLIGGIIVSSMAFAEINKPETGYQLMTLPASSLEKFISTWLFTSVMYSLMAFVIITIGAILLSSLGYLGIQVQGGIFNAPEMGEAFKQYFVGNIIFLAGAAAFKRNAFFKTMLFFVVTFLFFSIYTVSLAEMFDFSEISSSNSSSSWVINGSTFGSDMDYIFGSTEIAVTVMKSFLVLFFLSVGFYKFKEREL